MVLKMCAATPGGKLALDLLSGCLSSGAIDGLHGVQPGLRKKTFLFRILAIPERRPKIFVAVIVLGNAASETDPLHDAVSAHAL